MSITDELRKYVQDWRETPNLMDDLDAGDVDGILADFESIADRIDAEHEKVMSRAGQLLDDAEKERDYNYANWQDCKQKVLQHNITLDELDAKIECLKDELSHCIKLHKDVGGEYIHEHDKVDWRDHACTWHENATVVARIRQALTRLHLWIGEKLGLTHYRNCHGCIHRADCSDYRLVMCDLYLEEDGVLAATDPCEAVWCDCYVEKELQ